MINRVLGLLLLCLPALLSAPAESGAQENREVRAAESVPDSLATELSFRDLFAESVTLQTQKRYAEASAVLERILAENEDSEVVARSALDQLVHNHWRWENGTVEEVATRALYRFPDLQADEIWTPIEVQQLYDLLRSELFGSLTIRNPEGCKVYLEGEFVAETPYFEPFLKVGDYDLRVTKERRLDYHEILTVEPGVDHVYEEVPLPTLKDTRWWLTRSGLAGALAGTVWMLAAGGGGGDAAAEPLDGAPATP